MAKIKKLNFDFAEDLFAGKKTKRASLIYTTKEGSLSTATIQKRQQDIYTKLGSLVVKTKPGNKRSTSLFHNRTHNFYRNMLNLLDKYEDAFNANIDNFLNELHTYGESIQHWRELDYDKITEVVLKTNRHSSVYYDSNLFLFIMIFPKYTYGLNLDSSLTEEIFKKELEKTIPTHEALIQILANAYSKYISTYKNMIKMVDDYIYFQTFLTEEEQVNYLDHLENTVTYNLKELNIKYSGYKNYYCKLAMKKIGAHVFTRY